MKLTIKTDCHRLVRDNMSADEVIAAARALRRCRKAFERVPLTVLLEDDNGVIHIACRRGPLLTP